ncbi:MAG TPA: GGDEF domain-containing protein [Solirubrobacteraceae bacterium]|jgi:diguanylate cyclase (GGDEF)-like protein
MSEGQSLGAGCRRILLPSFVAALLPFVLLWLPGQNWRSGPLIAAAVLTLGIALVAFRAPWERLPSWAPCLPAFAYLGVVVLLRAAGGPSGVAPMLLLPVFWLGLFGSPRQLGLLLAAMTLVLIVPLIVVGGPRYPPTAWRAAILFLAVSAIVGATIQALGAYVRDQDGERNHLFDRLEELAHTDALTGLANRRAWENALSRGLDRGGQRSEPVSVALVDIDSFKAVNDVRGHPGGDSLLVEVARRWEKTLRGDDVLARIGGDEFAVLMPACGKAEAESIIERLRDRMPRPYSCSAGVATWDRGELADQLMLRADTALYEAKRAGRDRIAPGRLAASA